MSTYTSRLALVLGWRPDHMLTSRELRILLHYEAEQAKGHMTTNTALERTLHDLNGRNGQGSTRNPYKLEAAQ